MRKIILPTIKKATNNLGFTDIKASRSRQKWNCKMQQKRASALQACTDDEHQGGRLAAGSALAKTIGEIMQSEAVRVLVTALPRLTHRRYLFGKLRPQVHTMTSTGTYTKKRNPCTTGPIDFCT